MAQKTTKGGKVLNLRETSQDQLDTIYKIADRLSSKYVFGSYDKFDIYQEAVLIGLDGLKRYDGVRPLENFLHTHINNRLKNLKRDNYFRITTGNAEKAQQAKKDLLGPSSSGDPVIFSEQDIAQEIDTKELIEKISDNIPQKYRADYLKMCSGAKVSKKKKLEIISYIKNLIGENDI